MIGRCVDFGAGVIWGFEGDAVAAGCGCGACAAACAGGGGGDKGRVSAGEVWLYRLRKSRSEGESCCCNGVL